MSKPAQPKPSIVHVNVAAAIDPVAPDCESVLREQRFRLAHELQSSLDLRDTLSHFFTRARQVVKFSSLNFVNDAKRLNVTLGRGQKHRVEYNLSGDNYQLGLLSFSRDTPFSETELQGLEILSGILFYPLRNALLYREALDNSLRDTLTQVGNRAAMEMALKRELELAKRNNLPLSLLVIDIDHFKRVNDTCGHSVGDQVLTHIAAIIKDSLRQTDQTFRFGGEEFVVILCDTQATAAQMVANRIRTNVYSSSPFAGRDIRSSVSIGLAYLAPDDDRDSLFSRADSALYLAKQMGRNCVINETELGSTSFCPEVVV
ncbi:MAG TPA: GGDEF domain-containing protein [Cellvibrionaceae bacterium]|nr:GGDEF domain-containing protein [Cellvibrionaceae bacterium]